MAVVSVKELHQRRRSSWRDGKEAHTRVFLVTTNDAADGTRVALRADDGTTRVPAPHEALDGNIFIQAMGIEAQPLNDSDRHFEVTVEYATVSSTGPAPDDVHPLDRPPEVSWGSSDASESYFIDRSPEEKAVVNSAGDTFESFTERERGEAVITVTRNEAYHDAAEAEGYSHTVNAEAVLLAGTLYPAGTLKLSPITASLAVEVVTLDGQPTEVTYFKRTYVFKHRTEGWRDVLLDVGLNEAFEKTVKVNGVDTIVRHVRPILDAAGIPVKKPWPLDGNGRKKPSATDKPATLDFEGYAEVSWRALYF